MNSCSPRPRHHHRGPQGTLRPSMAGSSSPPRSATSATADSSATTAKSTCSTLASRLNHTPQTVHKSAKSRKTHSANPVARGFGLPGLSGAYRQPKLFRLADWPLRSQKRPMRPPTLRFRRGIKARKVCLAPRVSTPFPMRVCFPCPGGHRRLLIQS